MGLRPCFQLNRPQIMRTQKKRQVRTPEQNRMHKRPGSTSKSRLLGSLLVILFLGGCSSYGVIHNEPKTVMDQRTPYSLKTWAQSKEASDFVFILTFSGGGTRAAAMAYGVLEELRDTPITVDGQQKRLLDEVTHISSVSGGSFTSSYYGLYGDRIFEDFKDEFLLKDVQGPLTRNVLNPFTWFSRKGRTERAVEYYNKILFHDATFGDMMQPGRPMIIINASDLAYGVRFSFIQDYFNFLCSDVRDFPIASAVAASSAVPVVFNPVVVENYASCVPPQPSPEVFERAKHSDELAQTLEGLNSYNDKQERKFIHFVDGGITDNMGLRAISDVVTVSGGPQSVVDKMQRKIPRNVVFLSVNASTVQHPDMDRTAKQPSMIESMNAMTAIQLHRYNAATTDLVRNNLDNWAKELSTPEHKINTYFIEVSFEGVTQPQLKLFLNKIPTSFKLEPDQVDALIKNGRTLLRADPEFQQLVKNISES
jgi:NTE family protein